MAGLTVFVTDYTLADEMDLEAAVLREVGAELVRAQCSTEEEVLGALVPCDGMITQWAPVTRRVMAAAEGLRAVSRDGIGVDNIDLAAAEDLGIAVLNVPAYCIPEVADHAMSMVLGLLRKLRQTSAITGSGGWEMKPLIPIRRTDTLKLGIVGLGRIGSAVARRALPFFAEVIACDPFIEPERFESLGVRRVTHGELWAEADVITLHVPHKEDTHHMIDARAVGTMGEGVYLVNTCRGPVVDTQALLDGLRSGKIAGAGLDVHESEPLPESHELRAMDNVIVTPHVAYYSEESTIQARRETCENLVRFFKGEEPISRLV